MELQKVVFVNFYKLMIFVDKIQNIPITRNFFFITSFWGCFVVDYFPQPFICGINAFNLV